MTAGVHEFATILMPPHSLLTLLFAIMFLPTPGIPQSVGIRVPDREKKVGTPVAKPESRRKIFAEPTAILQKILSTSEERRRLGFRQLGIDPEKLRSRTAEVDDARLLAVNLDSDQDLEAILIYTIEPDTTGAVLDKASDGWWEVGRFSNWWHGSSLWADRLIELREIVSYGGRDIVVRTRNGGTGGAETDLAIYRLRAGRLYRTFHTTEQSEYDTSGPGVSGDWYVERHELLYPEPDSAGNRFLVVFHTRATLAPGPPSESRAPCAPKALACTVYRWHAEKFTFLRDEPSDSSYCDRRTKRPRASLVPGCASVP